MEEVLSPHAMAAELYPAVGELGLWCGLGGLLVALRGPLKVRSFNCRVVGGANVPHV